jgi:hypothetical protein
MVWVAVATARLLREQTLQALGLCSSSRGQGISGRNLRTAIGRVSTCVLSADVMLWPQCWQSVESDARIFLDRVCCVWACGESSRALPVQIHLSSQRGHRCTLDGKIISLDSHGKPQFRDLLFGRAEPLFYAFDILWDPMTKKRCADFGMERTLVYLPLTDRKLRLRKGGADAR